MEKVELEVKGKCAWIWFTEPRGLNPINSQYLDELGEILKQIASDDSIRGAVLATRGQNLSVGIDMKEISAGGAKALSAIGQRATWVFQAVADLPFPTLCLLNGHCIGGPIEMASGCDFRFAASDAKISVPGVRIGIFNPGMLTYRLPRIIGASRAKELMMQIKTIDAKTALDWGLVSEVHPIAEIHQAAEKWFETIAALEPKSLKFTKELIDKSFGFTEEEFQVLEKERLLELFESPTAVKLMSEFLKK